MSAERAIVRSRDGRETEVSADIRRYGAGRRAGTAAAVFGTAVVLGASSIVVPGVHFVAPWLLPLLGGGIALYLYNRVAVVDRVRGPCPSCGEAFCIEERGALGNDPLWLRCPHCGAPMELVDADPRAP